MSRKARKKKCNNYRKQKFKGDNYLRVIEGGALLRKRQKDVNIVPRNFHQDDLLGLIEDKNINIVFAVGPAGKGKTLISKLAGIRAIKQNKIDVISDNIKKNEQPGTTDEKKDGQPETIDT